MGFQLYGVRQRNSTQQFGTIWNKRNRGLYLEALLLWAAVLPSLGWGQRRGWEQVILALQAKDRDLTSYGVNRGRQRVLGGRGRDLTSVLSLSGGCEDNGSRGATVEVGRPVRQPLRRPRERGWWLGRVGVGRVKGSRRCQVVGARTPGGCMACEASMVTLASAQRRGVAICRGARLSTFTRLESAACRARYTAGRKHRGWRGRAPRRWAMPMACKARLYQVT